MKLTVVVLCCLGALVSSQFPRFTPRPPYQPNYFKTLDVIHNYRFEDHNVRNGPHLILAISNTETDKSCHIVEVANEWESVLKNQTLVERMGEELYTIITTHSLNETTLSLKELSTIYGDRSALRECYRHKIFELKYTPSFINP